MTDIVDRLKEYAEDDHERGCQGRYYDCSCGYDGKRDPLLKEAADEIERLRKAYSLTQDAVQQTLGRALGYPWFKDDQHNFPGATEADGVCVGDHVAESIADETAAKIAALRAALRFWMKAYRTHQHEPLVIAYESTLNRFPDLEARAALKEEGDE